MTESWTQAALWLGLAPIATLVPIQIVRYAERNHIDHISHCGPTLFERWRIGSVARQVIAYAHCAVTAVRSPAP